MSKNFSIKKDILYLLGVSGQKVKEQPSGRLVLCLSPLTKALLLFVLIERFILVMIVKKNGRLILILKVTEV